MYVAALDVGTGGLHVAVYTAPGTVIAEAYLEIGYSSDETGRFLEFDPEVLFTRSMNLLAGTIRRASLPEHAQLVLAVTGQRHGSVFLDQQMQPVLAVANLDGRVDPATLQGLQEDFGKIFHLAGRIPSEIFPATRLLWMREHQREVYGRIRGFLMINEWFTYRMTGVARCERTSISESLLVSLSHAAWSDELFSIFGLSELSRWEIVPPGTIVGTLDPSVARQFGLPNHTAVSLSAADTQCAAVGSGATSAGDVVVVNGSTTPVVMVTKQPILDPLQRTWTDLYVDDLFLLESNAGRTGMVYRDMVKLLSCQELPEASIDAVFEAQRRGISANLMPDPEQSVDFHQCPQELRFTADPIAALTLLPYLMMENTAFAVAANIAELLRVTGETPRRILLTGGSSRSELTQSILAVLLADAPLFLTETYDTTARGAAMLALVAANPKLSLEEVFSEGNQHGRKPLAPPASSRFADVIQERYLGWRQRYRDMALRNSG